MVCILGINAFHADSSAVLVCDGEIVNAAEEERFRRVKHWAGFPTEAISWCLSDAGISVEDVDHIAINSLSSAHRFRKAFYIALNRPSPRFLLNRWRTKRARLGLDQQFSAAFPDQCITAKFHFVEHHRAHMASAFYASDFDEAAVVSVDGFGDFASSAWGLGKGAQISIDAQVFFPHSLGIFYTALTQFLGFPNYGDEYKVMGLAPYGEPKYMEAMRQIVRLSSEGKFSLDLLYFNHDKQNIPHQWTDGSPVYGSFFSEHLINLLGPPRLTGETLNQRHKDIARSVQEMYEQAFFHMLCHLHKLHPLDKVCIAGGCGANSVANGKITRLSPFKQVYVQSAAGDAGGALGAALDVWHKLSDTRSQPMVSAYLGTRPHTSEIEVLLSDSQTSERLRSSGCVVQRLGDVDFPDENALLNMVSYAIDQGLVVGWFEGRMEWGPRALGHRSILGDPRRHDMKDILNLKIKRRESFRPFAPSILQELTSDWFDLQSSLDADVPYMMQVYPIQEDKRLLIPAVTHVDGTGRLQTVTEAENGRYYRLIRRFYELTGVPMLLNTSFNENEPIVSTPLQAIDCFLRTKMDLLVLDDVIVRRD